MKPIMLRKGLRRRVCTGFIFQLDAVDHDPSEIRITLNAFHTVVTDFFRIKITSVAFSAADTLPVVKHTSANHYRIPLRNNYTTTGNGRSSTWTSPAGFTEGEKNEQCNPESRKGETDLFTASMGIQK